MNEDFDGYYGLLVSVIERDPDVTQKSLANALGQSVNSVSRKLRREGLVFRIDELPIIISHGYNFLRPAEHRDYAQNYLALLNHLAEPLSCLVIQKPCAEKSCPADLEMSELMERFGYLSSRYVQARSMDGPGGRGLVQEEKDELLTLGCELQRRAAEFTLAVVAEKVEESHA